MPSLRLPIAVKVAASTALVLLLSIGVGVLALARLSQTNGDVRELGAKVVPATERMGELTTITDKIRKDQMHYVLADPAERADVVDDLKGDHDDVAALRRQFAPGSLDARYGGRLLEALAAYEAAAKPLFALSDRGDRQAAADILAGGAADKAWDGVKTAMSAWQQAQIRHAQQVNDQAEARYASARRLIIILLAGVLLIGVVSVAVLSRQIARQVAVILHRLTSLRERCTTDLRVGLDRMAAGDLTHEITPTTRPIERWSNDELGDIAQAVNAVRDNTHASVDAYNTSRDALAAMVGQVAGTAATVSSASQQMASTSDEAGRAVGEIASAVGEVAAGSQKQVEGIEDARRLTDEVAAATSRSADDAAQTAQAAEQARRIAAEGAAAVGEATAAMTSVRTASTEATEAIRALGRKSEEIGGIVGTIGGIAEQTNLLALNAAIEAARAGEQGRGFAVVAEEVRKLAEESQSAARSIATLIAEIQDETGRAVEVVEEGAGRTSHGASTVEQAREAFERIGSSVDDVTARVAQIAASVQQIASSAQQMGDRMSEVAAVAEQSSASTEQVSAGTEQTSASTQEIAASAQELARTAADLETLVGRFTLS
ncbi:MAG TPA: methyl-accepting chemotaxis protein [Baekduia sp.]|nr:methyl-accepting chemotaxis protein [Baekduia sp.]